MNERLSPTPGRRLVCEQCGQVDDGDAKGWRALLGREDGDEIVTCVFCPECARKVEDDG